MKELERLKEFEYKNVKISDMGKKKRRFKPRS